MSQVAWYRIELARINRDRWAMLERYGLKHQGFEDLNFIDQVQQMLLLNVRSIEKRGGSVVLNGERVDYGELPNVSDYESISEPHPSPSSPMATQPQQLVHDESIGELHPSPDLPTATQSQLLMHARQALQRQMPFAKCERELQKLAAAYRQRQAEKECCRQKLLAIQSEHSGLENELIEVHERKLRLDEAKRGLELAEIEAYEFAKKYVGNCEPIKERVRGASEERGGSATGLEADDESPYEESSDEEDPSDWIFVGETSSRGQKRMAKSPKHRARKRRKSASAGNHNGYLRFGELIPPTTWWVRRPSVDF